MRNRIHENVKFMGGVAPQTIATSTVTGAFVSLSEFRQALFLLTCGVIAATKNVVIQIVQATDNVGTGLKDIDGAILTLAGDDSTADGFVEIKSGDLDRNNYTHIAVKVTTDASIICGVSGLLGSGRFSEAQEIPYKVL